MRARAIAVSTAALLVAGAGVASAQTRAYAPPSVMTAAVSVPSPSARTCEAFATWNAHRTTAHLDALMTGSESVPWKHLGDDVTQLYSGVREGDAKYVAYAVKYVKADCLTVIIEPGGPIKPGPKA